MRRTPLCFVAALLLSINLLRAAGAVAADCTVSPSGVNFGSFSPLNLATVDSTGSITVNCTDVGSYSISLSPGSGTFTQRTMVSGGHTLFYNLYLDAAYQQIWGDGNSGSSMVTLTNPINGQDNVHTVYGRIPLSVQRAAHVGGYNDIITVTVSY
jgi:spore coat protein U-like protein